MPNMWNDPASQQLVCYVREMRVRAGMPSLRAVAAKVANDSGATISHTTAAALFNGTAIPSWNILERIVTAMGGEPATVQRLWQLAQTANMPAPANTPPPGHQFQQLRCGISQVAATYSKQAEQGWEPLHALIDGQVPGEVHLVMRRPNPTRPRGRDASR